MDHKKSLSWVLLGAVVCSVSALAVAASDEETLAVEMIEAAAYKGYTGAQVALGVVHNLGLLGTHQDARLANRWFQRAAEQGNADAQHNLAYNYYMGKGVPRNPSEAFKWDRRAAESGSRLAMNSLALAYEAGEGVTQDNAEAQRWLERAARARDGVVLRSLSEAYK